MKRWFSKLVLWVLPGSLALTLPVAAQTPNRLLHTFTATGSSQTGAGLGRKVAVDGTYAAVGAPLVDLGAFDAGAVKIFDTVTAALVHVLANPSPALNDQFGYSVAIAGTRVVVGAWLDDTGATDAGSVYVYDLGGPTPTLPALTLNNPQPVAGDNFGAAVAISGMRIVVWTTVDDTQPGTGGTAYVYDLSSATPKVPVATLYSPSPESSDSRSTCVAISGTRVVIGVNEDDTGASNAGIAYVFDLDSATPAVPTATLRNPEPERGEYFGWAVAISDTRVVVGAYADNSQTGSAYVFDVGSNTPAIPIATLPNPHPAFGDGFGAAVAISGSRIVVGAEADVADGSRVGGAYVYNLNTLTPTVPIATLTNPSPGEHDFFGISVAISGSSVVVGASGDDTRALGAGSAYVFSLQGAPPTAPVATLQSSDPAGNEQFGTSVALSGNVVVVGAPYEDAGPEADTGRVSVYFLTGDTPAAPVATLRDPTPLSREFFGQAVAVSGTRLVVGAPGEGLVKGAAYVYELASPEPSVPVLTLPGPGSDFGSYGAAVALSGTRMVVGNPVNALAGFETGRVYVHDLTHQSPAVPVATLDNPTPAPSDRFGTSVATAGSLVVVGANWDDTGANNAGSAYIYDLASPSPTNPVLTLKNPAPAANDQFGGSVAISGRRVVVGANLDDTGATDAGIAYVFDLDRPTPTAPAFTLRKPVAASNDQFGTSVAISGSRIVVSVYRNDTGAHNAGSAYVFDLDSATPTVPVSILHNPSPADSDYFALSVAIDGTFVAVGAPFDDSINVDSGAAYLFGPSDADHDGLPDAWELTYWPTTSEHGALDDSDHDGYPELLELGFGLNPTIPEAGGLPEVREEGGFLTVTITKRPGVTYQVQSAGTLLIGQPDSFSPDTTWVITNSATTLKMRDLVPLGTSTARFMRVVVRAAP